MKELNYDFSFLCSRALKLQGINSSLLNNLNLNDGEEKKEVSSERCRFKILHHYRDDSGFIRSVILFSPEVALLKKNHMQKCRENR